MKKITITIGLEKDPTYGGTKASFAMIDNASVHITNTVVSSITSLVKENASFKDVSVHFMDIKIENTNK